MDDFTGATFRFSHKGYVTAGQAVVFNGVWADSKYGEQLQVISMEYDTALSVDGLANYLANNKAIKHIGPARARMIARQFADNFEEVLLKEPERLAAAIKVPLDVITNLQAEWEKNLSVNHTMIQLAEWGLTHHQITTLVEKFGNDTATILKADPYMLIGELTGFGFLRVDKIARDLHIEKIHPGRVRAGIFAAVAAHLDEGSTWVERERLVENANEILIIDSLDSKTLINTHMDSLLQQGALTACRKNDQILVAAPWARKMENDIGFCFIEKFRRLEADPNIKDHIRKILSDKCLEQNRRIDLKFQQEEAIYKAFQSNISLIAGGAGSGKTFTLDIIVRLCKQYNKVVALCAPTGKAAKRIEQVVGEKACTIHRLLEHNGMEFTRTRECPLTPDVIIVDELSMVDVPLFWHLCDAIDFSKTTLILVGDHNQLPPVGCGNVLRDLINTRVIPTTLLNEVVRQAGVLRANSLDVLKGVVAKTTDQATGVRPWYLVDQFSDENQMLKFLADLYGCTLAERLGYHLLNEVQLLTPMHKGTLGTEALNVYLQKLIQKKLYNVDAPAQKAHRLPELLVGDKVIQIRNNYGCGKEKLPVMNGSIGIIRDIVVDDKGDELLQIQFDDATVHVKKNSDERRDLRLAYALTPHKYQGSEVQCAIVICHKMHSFITHRNWLYTAVTRASRTCMILGDQWGIRNTVSKVQVDARNTFLQFLQAPADRN